MLKPRAAVETLRRSQIREVANAGLERDDVLPFWFGEADQPSAEPIRQAAAEAVLAGRTFYTHNLGRRDLREALATYLTDLHGTPTPPEALAVSSSGVSALMIGCQTVIEPGDRVVVVTPVWPNLVEIPKILSASVETAPLTFADGRFTLDLERLLSALTPDTRLLILNSPNNPTGWTLAAEQRAPLLEHCRRHGVWILADDVYERLNFDGSPSAPSFVPLADAEDRLISTNSFSKTWSMTGFRLGWLRVPPSITDAVGVLIEYNTSCAPDFVQAAGLAAIAQGEAAILGFRSELRDSRDLVLRGLRALRGVEAACPEGGLYVFFRTDRRESSLDLAKDILARVGVGLAPGSAFGDVGEGWLRWCFAARPEKNLEGLRRLRAYLSA